MSGVPLGSRTAVIQQVAQYLSRLANPRSAGAGLVSVEVLEPLERLLREYDYHRPELPRILLLGEFKAGKSSLLNALVGTRVAAVAVLEMTAWITRCWPSSRDFCAVRRFNGAIEEMSIETFVERCTSRAWSAASLESIEAVDIGLCHGPHYAFIDAPGMGSTTRLNEKRLARAIDEADLAAWVVDVDALGSERVFALAGAFHASDLPQIAIVTKCDLLESESERREIAEYVANHLGLPERRVLLTGGLDGHGPSFGIEPLRDFLEHDVGPRGSELRANARRAHEDRVLAHCADLLLPIAESLESAEEGWRRFTDLVSAWRGAVQSQLELDTERLVRARLFAEQRSGIRDELCERLRHGGALSKDGVARLLAERLGSDYYDRFWQGVLGALSGQAAAAWREQLERMGTEIDDIIGEFRGQVGSLRLLELDPQDVLASADRVAVSTFEDGIKTTVGIAGAAAAYAAWAGPAAAQITLGAALGTVGFPILAIGAGISAGMAYVRRQRELATIEQRAEILLAQLVDEFVATVLRPLVWPRIAELNHRIEARILERFEERVAGFLPDGDLESHRHEVADLQRSLAAAASGVPHREDRA